MMEIEKRGFTLLELLVVMAIIGVLAAVTWAYMGQTRNKGGDAGVQQNLINARSQAEVFFASNGNSYQGVCATVSGAIGRHVRAAQRAYGGTPKMIYTDAVASTWNTEECHDSGDRYVVWVPLNASANGSPRGLCIDSANTTKEATSVLAGNAMQCP